MEIMMDKKNVCKKVASVGVALTALFMSASAMAAGTNTLTVSANVVGTCKFSTATSTLAFGALDPSVATNVNAAGSTQYWCTKGVTTASIAADNGANFSVARRMKHTTAPADFIPYSLTLTPSATAPAGPGTPLTLALAGTVLGTDYTAVSAGNYTDTVTLTITP
jgi:spore coat protein U-like protein